MRSRRLLALARSAGLLGVLSLGPRGALAQSANDKAAAEALFDEGKKLLEQDRTAEACKAFEASQKLDAGVGTLLYLADCYERTDRFASAWATFREAAAMAKTAADDKREQIARGRADALEGKLFKLTVSAQDPVPGLVIKRDGEPLGPSAWGVGLPIDAGTHALEASAPGYVSFARKVEVPKTAGSETVVIPRLEKDEEATRPPDVPPPTTTGAPPPTTPPIPPPEERGSGLLIGGLVVGGLGVVGLAVTGALAGVASSKYAEGDDACEGTVCSDPAAVEQANDARQLGDVPPGTFIAGLGLAAIGATLVIVHFATAPDEGGATQVGFSASPDGGRLGVWGRF